MPTSVGDSPIGNSPSGVSQSVIPMRDDYEYDPLNRLKKVTGKQFDGSTESQIYTQTFTYDPFGNRKIDAANTSGTGINNKVYEANKRNNRLGGQVYDAAGNVINDSYTFRLNDRKYDAENRMTQAAGTDGAANYYVYDGDGRRVRRIVNGVETWQVYGIDGELLAEYAAGTAATSPQKDYGYRSGQLLIVVEQGSSVSWLVPDHLGTPRIIVDVSGGLTNVRRHDYLPFGEELTPAMTGGTLRSGGNGYVSDAVRQKFVGYEQDSETGLDFAQARYYANVQGRFTSVDPLHSSSILTDPQSWNRYSYGGNRPTIFIDPAGLAWGYFSGNAGNWYQWFDDPADIKKNGGTLASINGGAGSHIYQAIDDKWIRLNPNSNVYESYETELQAFYGQQEIPTAMGDLGNTLNLFSGLQGVAGLTRLGLGRIFAGAGAEITTVVTTELRFTQTTASAEFGAKGLFTVKTIGQVSDELRSGILNPSQVPVQYIEGEGVNLLVNTRSALSLMRGGVPRNQWNLVNVSGDAGVQASIADRLLRNGLANQGTDVLRITGAGKNASSLR